MKKILIVDDYQDIREMLTLLFQKEGYKTESAKDGTDFLNKVDKINPDLVILDVMMPGPTTEEILQQMKKKTCRPKIILLTVMRFSEEKLNKLLELDNIVDYIKKPYDTEVLLDCVKKHI